MNTRNKAILIILVVILLMSGVFISIALYEYKYSSQLRMGSHEKGLEFLVETELKQLSRTYSSRLNGFIRANKDIINNFKDRNRQELIRSVSQRFNTFKSENPDFEDIKFILPDGMLFVSMADSKSYGIDMSANSYIRALKNGADFISGFIISDDRLYFQVVQDVIINGETIGIIEFRTKTNEMNSLIKAILGAEYGLAVASQHNDSSAVSDAAVIDRSSSIYDRLPAGFNFAGHINSITIGKYTYMIHIQPIRDFSGTTIGYYLTSNDVTDIKKRFRMFFAYVLLITAGVIVVSFSVLYMGFGSILKKLEVMNANLEKTVGKRTHELNEAKNKAEDQNRLINSMLKRFKSMFQEHHSIMLLINPQDGRIVDANKAAISFMQSDKGKLTDMSISDIAVLPESDIKRVLEKASSEGLKDFITKFDMDGQLMDVEIQASPIEMERQTLLFAICHDVTEKVRIENEIKDLNKTLEKRVENETEKRRQQELLLIQQSKMSSVGEVLSAIIHQWKQPMTALSYLIQDISDSASRGVLDSEYIINTSDEALSQINYMTKTVDDFRKFLMPSKTKEDFNTAESVISTIKILSKQLEKDSIDFHLTIINALKDAASFRLEDLNSQEELGIGITCFTAFGYPNEFKQVLMNIVNNARDAINTRRQTEEFDGVISVVVSCDVKSTVITVSDNAGGIPKDIMDRIFEPYFTTKTGKGTGIGLYMAKSIIENHMEGSITADNCDRGALFTIILKSRD